jgi:hypothetical protein
LSDPSDSFERAAEANADRIMSGAPSNTLGSAAGAATFSAQRQVAPQEEDEAVQTMQVQREAAPEEEEKEPQP